MAEAVIDGVEKGPQSQSYVQIYLLTVNVIKAQDLKAADLNMSSDPFVEVKCNNDVYTTKIIYKNLNPVWNEQHLFCFIEEPKVLEMTLWDKDELTQNDLLGTCEVQLKPYFDNVKSSFVLQDNKLVLAPSNEKNNQKNLDQSIVLDVITDKHKHKTKGKLFLSLKCEKLYPLETEMRLFEMIHVVDDLKIKLHNNEELLNKSKKEWEASKHELEHNLSEKTNELQILNTKYNKLDEDFKNLENQLKSTVQKFENEVHDLKANIVLKTDENAKLEREKKNLTDENSKLERDKKNLTDENAKLQSEKKTLIDENGKLLIEKKNSIDENVKLLNEKKNLIDENAKSDRERKNLADENLKLNEKIQENIKTINDLNKKFNEETQNLNQQIKNQDENVRQLHETINNLQNQVNNLQEQNSNDKSSLLNNSPQKQQGGCCGVM